MQIDIGKTIRLNDIIDSNDNKALLIDTTVASTLGSTEGMENLAQVLQKINCNCDGIIINVGQAEHNAGLLAGKKRAAPIVRMDWTNAFRDEEFCLPVGNVKRCMISNGEDALTIGASAVIATMFLGFDDEFEAENIKDISHLARECHTISLPVLVDIRPIGPGVNENNYEDSIKLGLSFMLELGADCLIIPECSESILRAVGNWIKVPVLVRFDKIPSGEDMQLLFDCGLAGIVLTEKIFTKKNYENQIVELYKTIHDKSVKKVS